jgi:hypothetical protein
LSNNKKNQVKRGGCISCEACKRRCNLSPEEKTDRIMFHSSEVKKQKEKTLIKYILKRRQYLEKKIKALQEQLNELTAIRVTDVQYHQKLKWDSKKRKFDIIRSKTETFETR